MLLENSLRFLTICLRRKDRIFERFLTRLDSGGDRLEREPLQNEPEQQEHCERPEHQAAARREKSSRRFLSRCFLNQEKWEKCVHVKSLVGRLMEPAHNARAPKKFPT